MHQKHVSKWVAVGCFLNLSVSFSAVSPAFNGPYFGAEFGESLASSNQTVNSTVNLGVNQSYFSSTQPFNINSSMVRSAPAGSLFAGVSHVWDLFYLGGELALSNSYYKMGSSSASGITRTYLGMATISGNQSVTTTANISPTQLGVFLRPGVMLTPTSLLYGRVGASAVNVRYSTTSNALRAITQTQPTAQPAPYFQMPLTLQTNKKVTRAAFQIGTGVEQALNDKLTLRLDYLYSYYGTIRTTAAEQSTGIDEFALTGSGTQSIRMYAQSIMLGLSYHVNA